MGFWAPENKNFKNISAGGIDFIMGINRSGKVELKKDSGWKELPNTGSGNAIKVACGDQRTALVIAESDNTVWYFDREKEQFLAINNATPGGAHDISVGNNTEMWGISDQAYDTYGNYKPFKYYGLNHWNVFGSGLVQIAVGTDGTKMGINAAGLAFIEHGGGSSWHILAKTLKLADLGSAEMMMGVDKDNKIWRYVGLDIWYEVPFTDIDGKGISGNIIDISVSPDNAMHILTDEETDNNLYHYIPFNPNAEGT